MSGLAQATIASLIAGLAAGVGGLPALAIGSLSARWRAALLGIGAGVMLGASFFSLLLPALELGGSGPTLLASLLAGAGIVHLLNQVVPHEHFEKGHEGPKGRLSRAWMFVLAIAIHNGPEGLAVGVGFATGQDSVSLPLAIGITLHNLPEGLVVATSLLREGQSRWRAVGVALATGMIEPLMAVPAYLAASAAQVLLVPGLALAAGTMIYVVSDEIIPESHESGHAAAATWGVLAGFCVMLLLEASWH